MSAPNETEMACESSEPNKKKTQTQPAVFQGSPELQQMRAQMLALMEHKDAIEAEIKTLSAYLDSVWHIIDFSIFFHIFHSIIL